MAVATANDVVVVVVVVVAVVPIAAVGVVLIVMGVDVLSFSRPVPPPEAAAALVQLLVGGHKLEILRPLDKDLARRFPSVCR